MKAQFFSIAALGLLGSIVLTSSAQAQSVPTEPTDYNYVGLGVGVGDVGDSDFGLAVNGKVTVGNNVSVRPSVLTDFDFSDGGTAFQIPLTYDFNPVTANGKLLPYAGGGVAFTVGDDSDVGPLLTAGVDYRVTEEVTLNGAVNWAIYDDSQVNGVVGVGYTF
ncbi:hypothetical protein PN498_13800 [Oscillatoria sp. CS-180]|uniref:outer membrane protein n=1 Tax=Oscillatoria sp. CS-180 TaxID=3021720 RepID=UPI00233049A8|nr:outer membrane beta-barrel protein [Oscillatoria sp. CS-180]MDB9527070.1 hypothetical protein [Oscillatoria sp. CS-180]